MEVETLVYLEEAKARFKPRYGCGKCRHLVPCETGIPNKQFESQR